MSVRARSYLVLAIVVVLASARAWCGESGDGDEKTWRTVSDSIVPYLAVSELTLAMEGRHEAGQTAKALATTTLVTYALKLAIPDERPDGDGMDSFPSGHTSAAFAMATCLAAYKPGLGLLAYGAAAAIGYSRIEVKAHEWDDVIVGALIGYYIARQFTSHKQDVMATSTAITITF